MPILKLVLNVNQTLFRKSGMVPQNFFEWGLRDFTFASTKRMVHIHFSCLSMSSKLIVCANAYAIVIKVEIDKYTVPQTRSGFPDFGPDPDFF